MVKGGNCSELPCERVLASRYVTPRSSTFCVLVFSFVKVEVMIKLIHTFVEKINQGATCKAL